MPPSEAISHTRRGAFDTCFVRRSALSSSPGNPGPAITTFGTPSKLARSAGPACANDAIACAPGVVISGLPQTHKMSRITRGWLAAFALGLLSAAASGAQLNGGNAAEFSITGEAAQLANVTITPSVGITVGGTTLTFNLTLSTVTGKVRQSFALRWGSNGVVITLVDETKAQNMDLKRGEVILQVNQEEVWKPDQVVAKYRQAKKTGAKHLLLFVDGIGGYRFSLLPVR